MKAHTLVVLGAALLALDSVGASAQMSAAGGDRSSTKGFVIGLGPNGTSIEIDDPEIGGERESGAGVNVVLGYNFTPQIGIFLNASAAKIDDDEDGYAVGHGDLALRYAFASPARAFAPYVELGYSGIAAFDEVDDSDAQLAGNGFTGALGVNYFLTRGMALDLNYRYTTGKFTSLTIDGEEISNGESADVTTGRLNLGLSFFP